MPSIRFLSSATRRRQFVLPDPVYRERCKRLVSPLARGTGLIALLVLCALTAACASAPSVSEETVSTLSKARQAVTRAQDPAAQRFIESHDFLGLFRHADEIGFEKGDDNYIISDAVHSYLMACCKTVDQAVRLLRRSGFRVRNTTKQCTPSRPTEPGEYIHSGSYESCVDTGPIVDKGDYRAQGYDDVYVAERNTGFLVFLPVYTEYRVILYIRDGVVVRSTARVTEVAL